MKLKTEKQYKNQWKKELILEEINKIGKPLITLKKLKTEKIQITNIRHEIEDISIDAADIKT